jgi:deoxycytidylate deaminase
MGMSRDEYYMRIAMAVRLKANCLGRRVGAVIVKENRVISTGYNGTPEGSPIASTADVCAARTKRSTRLVPVKTSVFASMLSKTR